MSGDGSDANPASAPQDGPATGRRGAYVVVYRSSDPLELELLESFLRDQGIVVRGLGTRNAALIGGAEHIFGLRIEVPEDQAERAREAVRMFLAEGGELSPDELPDELRVDPEAPKVDPLARPRRRRVVALGAAFVVPGGGHLYVRRPWTALILGLAEVAAVVLCARGHGHRAASWDLFIGGALALGTLIVWDLIGAQRALASANVAGGLKPARQALAGFAALVVAALVGGLVGPQIPEPHVRLADPNASHDGRPASHDRVMRSSGPEGDPLHPYKVGTPAPVWPLMVP